MVLDDGDFTKRDRFPAANFSLGVVYGVVGVRVGSVTAIDLLLHMGSLEGRQEEAASEDRHRLMHHVLVYLSSHNRHISCAN
ncbi:hypothetical protein D3C73_1586100 [compost metagenome]